MIDGIVRQTADGVVIECSALCECMKNNPDVIKGYDNHAEGLTDSGLGNGCWKKQCQLSVPDHGNRCKAWPKDTSTWVIDIDTSKIKEIFK